MGITARPKHKERGDSHHLFEHSQITDSRLIDISQVRIKVFLLADRLFLYFHPQIHVRSFFLGVIFLGHFLAGPAILANAHKLQSL